MNTVAPRSVWVEDLERDNVASTANAPSDNQLSDQDQIGHRVFRYTRNISFSKLSGFIVRSCAQPKILMPTIIWAYWLLRLLSLLRLSPCSNSHWTSILR